MENAVSQSPFNLKEEGGGLDRCHYAPTAIVAQEIISYR
jgi:hypothetical protein